MITLHEAIRTIQDELIKSEVERKQEGIPALFETKKLVIELSCVFTESENSEIDGKVNAISVVSLDSKLSSTTSSEKMQKITIEFSTTKSEDHLNRPIPSHGNDNGIFPHRNK